MEISVIANPAPFSFKWYKLTDGNNKTLQNRSSYDEKFGMSYKGTLTLIGIQKEDFGIYQIVVSNNVSRDLIEDIALTQETGDGASISSLTLNNQPTNLTVNEGVNVTLRCQVDGNPRSDIKLLTDSTVLNEEKNSTVAEYTLNATGCLDSEKYTCVAEHNNISTSNKTVLLSVLCSPRLDDRVQFKQKYSAAVDSTVTMEISVIANPAPFSFKWYKLTDGKNKTLQNRSSYDDTSGMSYKGTLTLISIQKEDFGIYHIVVSNNVSRDLIEDIALTQETGGVATAEDSHVISYCGCCDRSSYFPVAVYWRCSRLLQDETSKR
ncbi:limbic system-associated membrane protein-like [Gigantopelta aegis]|uniref:limbic system-associated membrane protein-like n=1 Tax=Gigantopelta aegis TaxID=1735272 RepID=UPI001B88BEDB|nr:limbic system-associated membrane protein-like [Gigantopelta aegis]